MKHGLILLFSILYHVTFAQKAFVELGAGFGNVLEADHNAAKGLLFVNGHLSLSKSFQGGIELATGGDLLPVSGTNDVQNNQVIVWPYSVRFNTAMLKARYRREKSFGILFLGIGAGINTYKRYVHASNTDQVTRHNLSGVAEIGIALEHDVTASIRYHSKGKTPSFEGSDESGSTISLAEEKVSAIYFTLAYRLSFD